VRWIPALSITFKPSGGLESFSPDGKWLLAVGSNDLRVYAADPQVF